MIHVAWGIIVACGKSEQLNGGADVAFLSSGDSPVLAYSMNAFEQCAEIEGIVIVANKEKLEYVANLVRLYGCNKVRKIVPGTASRSTSIQNALKVMDESVSLVSIHDVSRPCVRSELIGETVRAAKRYGSGVAAIRVEDAIKEVEKGQTSEKSLEGGKLWAMQTPQTFKRDLIEKGLEAATKGKILLGDESEALHAMKQPVHLVVSEPSNVKIRNADDLVVVSALLKVI